MYGKHRGIGGAPGFVLDQVFEDTTFEPNHRWQCQNLILIWSVSGTGVIGFYQSKFSRNLDYNLTFWRPYRLLLGSSAFDGRSARFGLLSETSFSSGLYLVRRELLRLPGRKKHRFPWSIGACVGRRFAVSWIRRSVVKGTKRWTRLCLLGLKCQN